jgi:hypothetical protein
MTKRQRQRIERQYLKGVFQYLENQRSEAFDAQDIELFDYYTNGQTQWTCLFDGTPFVAWYAVPERFYKATKK